MARPSDRGEGPRSGGILTLECLPQEGLPGVILEPGEDFPRLYNPLSIAFMLHVVCFHSGIALL